MGSSAGGPDGDSAFIWDRTQALDRDVMAAIHDEATAQHSRTRLDPRAVLGDKDMAFTAGLLVPRTRYSVGHGPDGEFTLWLADTSTGSWASVDYAPGATEYDVDQHGSRMLWDEIQASYDWWTSMRCPERTQYGMTVTPESQHLWLENPHQRVGPIRSLRA